jgi:hypothetical protein
MNQTTSTNHFPGLSAHCFDAIAFQTNLMVLHASREAAVLETLPFAIEVLHRAWRSYPLLRRHRNASPGKIRYSDLLG